MKIKIAYALKEGLIPENEDFDCYHFTHNGKQFFTLMTDKKALTEVFKVGYEMGKTFEELEQLADEFDNKIVNEVVKNYVGFVEMEVA